MLKQRIFLYKNAYCHFFQLQIAQCQDCTPGDYCNTEGLNATEGPCPGGHYCPLGTDDPYSNPCGVGLYRNGSARESAQDCAVCPAGYFCDR